MKKSCITILLGIALFTASCKKEMEQTVLTPTSDSAMVLAAAAVEPAYNVKTIAGVFTPANSDPHLLDGKGPVAKFYKPHGITVAGDGSIYVADFLNNAIRKITIQNNVYTIALPYSQTLSGQLPEAVTIATDGTLYVVSTSYGVRIYNNSKGIDISSRIGNSDSNLDIEKDSKGVMWFVNDNSLCKITRINIQRNVVNFSGVLAANETLRAIGVGPSNVKYVSTATQLFKVDASGKITKLFPSYKFTFISGITVTKDGSTLYIADGNAVKMIKNNNITTIAKPLSNNDGRDGVGLLADVVAANLALSNTEKALFVSDTRNTIRKIILP
jgi:hypothetical protein